MDWKETFVLVVYCILVLLYGYMWGYDNGSSKQSKINNQLATEYKWQLESCYQQLGDMQDDYDVNNDGMIDALDYVAIKKYILNQGENE